MEVVAAVMAVVVMAVVVVVEKVVVVVVAVEFPLVELLATAKYILARRLDRRMHGGKTKRGAGT